MAKFLLLVFFFRLFQLSHVLRFLLKVQDSQILQFLTTPLTPGLWLLILSRLPERQGRTAVSQKDTLIFISHPADIWEEHLSEALRATRTLIYSRNCFLRQVALLAKFRMNSWTIKAWGRFWLPALLEEILFALYFAWPSQPPSNNTSHFLMALHSVAFIVQNINNYYASSRLKNYLKPLLASVPKEKETRAGFHNYCCGFLVTGVTPHQYSVFLLLLPSAWISSGREQKLD